MKNMNHTNVSNCMMPPQALGKSPGSGLMVGMSLPGCQVPQQQQGAQQSQQGSVTGGPGPLGEGSQSQQPTSSSSGEQHSSPVSPSAGGTSGTLSPTTMANTKEKTPMCLINELARFNKVQHQYRLVDELGPAHKKTFTVVLKLDSEEYKASGPSIKKAQHLAAALALEQTVLKHPPPKSQRQALGPITPTVELNALAMKRGELAVYQVVENPRPHYFPNFNYRGMCNQRYHYPRMPPTCYVSLKVGNRQFFGEGRTSQAARHAAAEEALRVMRDIPLPDHVKKENESNNTVKTPVVVPAPPLGGITSGSCPPLSDGGSPEPSEDLKSPISLVHEIALKRWLPVNFEVTRESGPPHMRTFITRCIVGELITEGEGNGKKISKKRAAEKMLDELKKLPSLPATPQKVKKKPIIKKKSRNLIKCSEGCGGVQEPKGDSQYGQGINPISRLIQIQQAKKEREPVYTVLAERGEPRQREFIMQCSLNDLVTNGAGPNKKTAKRNAAESMLQMMGYSRLPPQGSNSSSTMAANSVTGSVKPLKGLGPEGLDGDKNRKVTFLDHDGDKLDGEGKLGRQLVPGLLLMPDAVGLTGGTPGSMQGFNTAVPGLNRAPGGPIQNQDVMSNISCQTISAIAKELLENGVSSTAENIRCSGHKPISPQNLIRPKQQLTYLADVLGLKLRFNDFSKGNTQKYLTLVSLSTCPPQVCHGSGATQEISHDQAALTALKALCDLTLDPNGTSAQQQQGPNGSSGTFSVQGDGKESNSNSSPLGVLTNGGLHITGGGKPPAPKLANSPTADLGGNLKAGAGVTSKEGH